MLTYSIFSCDLYKSAIKLAFYILFIFSLSQTTACVRQRKTEKEYLHMSVCVCVCVCVCGERERVYVCVYVELYVDMCIRLIVIQSLNLYSRTLANAFIVHKIQSKYFLRKGIEKKQISF